MKRLIVLTAFLLVPGFSQALEPLTDQALNDVSAQEGVTVILEDFKVTTHTGLTAIGGDDGLGIPAVPDGAWFVLDSTRTSELVVENGAIDFDALTTGPDGLAVGRHGDTLPANRTAALVDFGEAYFHVNMTDARLTLKFANNPRGNEGDGVTVFSDTVCNVALSGSTVTIKSDDAKMYIYSH
ncbi:hypothetical protein JCM14469_16390 [Desulfatiferula olefinivorans]